MYASRTSSNIEIGYHRCTKLSLQKNYLLLYYSSHHLLASYADESHPDTFRFIF